MEWEGSCPAGTLWGTLSSVFQVFPDICSIYDEGLRRCQKKLWYSQTRRQLFFGLTGNHSPQYHSLHFWDGKRIINFLQDCSLQERAWLKTKVADSISHLLWVGFSSWSFEIFGYDSLLVAVGPFLCWEWQKADSCADARSILVRMWAHFRGLMGVSLNTRAWEEATKNITFHPSLFPFHWLPSSTYKVWEDSE